MTKRKFSIVEGGPDRVEQFIKEAAEMETVRFEEQCHHAIRRCESPIERLLMAALYASSKIQHEKLFFYGCDEMPKEPDFDEAVHIFQQIKFGQYRVDIAIWDASLPFNHTPPRMMVVECDGHDFHEKTKEQARRDKQRDRFLVSKGYKVLRYTGSEIWADPGAIADDIINELACNDYWRNRGT